MSGKKVKSIKMPSAYVIIYAVIVAVGIWTHFVGGDVVPATLADILLAPSPASRRASPSVCSSC